MCPRPLEAEKFRKKDSLVVCVCVCEIVDEGFKQKFDLMYQIEEKSFGIETLGDYSLC